MKRVIVALFDKAAAAYLEPRFVPAVGVALREFEDAVNSGEKTPFAMHPEHFEMYLLGSFDDATGVFSLDGAMSPTCLANGASLVRTRS